MQTNGNNGFNRNFNGAVTVVMVLAHENPNK